jgi:hypothetical protein
MPHDPEVAAIVHKVWTEVGGEGIDWADWVEHLTPYRIDQLAQVAVGLQGGKMLNSRAPNALEAVRMVVDAKLAAQTQELMVKLDAATRKLQFVGVMVGVVGVAVMVC